MQGLPTTETTNGPEWLRAIRGDLQREIGQTPQERAAYCQAKEKKLRGRTLRTPRRARQAAVTSSECDGDTICPEYKVVAADVERVSAPAEKKAPLPGTIAVQRAMFAHHRGIGTTA